MAKTSMEPLRARKEINGEKYVLTKIDFSEEDAKGDAAYYQERGRKTKIEQSGINWLVYTKIGQ